MLVGPGVAGAAHGAYGWAPDATDQIPVRLPFRSIAPTLVACVAALLVAACSDSTAPGTGTREVTVATRLLAAPTPVYFTVGDTAPGVECDPVLQAVVKGGGQLRWTEARIRWYMGVDRTTPVDSDVVSADAIASWWGQASAAAGDSMRTTLRFSAGLPFAAQIDFGYQTAGKDTVSTVRFDCGPILSSSSPLATESLTNIALPTTTIPGGDLEPGDTVAITYTAHADPALWEEDVGLTGACTLWKRIPEQLNAQITRTVKLVVPASCRMRTEIGATELGVAVVAVDMAGRATGAQAGTGHWVVDVRPPTVQPMLYTPHGTELFAGDTLRLSSGARDNHGLAMLFWEETASGARDSVAIQDTVDVASHPIVVPSTWGGPTRFRAWARDVTGLTSDTIDVGPLPHTAVPTVQRATRIATVQGDVEDVAYDARRQQLYLAQADAGRVLIVSTASMQVVGAIDLSGGRPTSLDLSVGGDSLIVALQGAAALAIVDLRQPLVAPMRVPIAALASATDQAAMRVRVLANNRAYVTVGGTSTDAPSSVLEIDLVTGTQRIRGDAGRRTFPAKALGRSYDRSVLVLNDGCLQRYTVASDVFTTCRTDAPQWAPVADATGSTFATSAYVYDGTLVTRLAVTSYWGTAAYTTPIPVALSPDGSALYQISGTQLGIIRSRTADGTTFDTSPIAGIAPDDVRATDDGQYLIVVQSSGAGSAKVGLMSLR